MDVEQLRQLVCISEASTFSAAAKQLHISQSALTRSMQRLEAELGVDLFDRRRNRAEMNDTGRVAMEYARTIVSAADHMASATREFASGVSKLRVGTCAPAPLWPLAPSLAAAGIDVSIDSEPHAVEDLLDRVAAGTLDLAIVLGEQVRDGVVCSHLADESLCVSLPLDSPLAKERSVSFSQLDGMTFLVYSKIGTWAGIHRRNLPRSVFQTYDDYLVFANAASATPLPTFVTDLSRSQRRSRKDRAIVPISDADAHASYYVARRADDRQARRAVEVLAG